MRLEFGADPKAGIVSGSIPKSNLRLRPYKITAMSSLFLRAQSLLQWLLLPLSLGPNALQVLDRSADVYQRIRAEGYVYNRFGGGERRGEVLPGGEDYEVGCE